MPKGSWDLWAYLLYTLGLLPSADPEGKLGYWDLVVLHPGGIAFCISRKEAGPLGLSFCTPWGYCLRQILKGSRAPGLQLLFANVFGTS